MFARSSLPISLPVTGSDRLAGMAHAMGCGILVEESRQTHPVFLVRGGNIWLVERRSPAAPHQYG